MDDFSLLKQLDTVTAPPGFEQGVLARLSLEKRVTRRHRPALALSLAGAFASLLAVFVGLNVFVLHRQPPVAAAKAEASGGAPAQQIIPVIETFDYGTEVRSRAPESGTIYLLEQVSDTAPKGIMY